VTPWPTLPLKRVVSPARAITYGIVQAGENYPNGVPYIRPIDMTQALGVPDVAALRRTSPEIAAAYRRSRIRPGDLVVSIGPSFGKIMVVPDKLDGANLTQGTARIAPDSNVVPRFLYWALQSAAVMGQWSAAVGGATFRALNLEPLANTLVPLPPLEEQRRIADFLDAETTTLADLERLRAAQASLVVERESAGISVTLEDPLRRHVKLGHLARLQSGVTVRGTRSVGNLISRPYLRVANVKEDRLELDDVTEIEVTRQEAARSSLRLRDVLMTEGGDLNKLGRGTLWNGEIDNCLHQNHVFAIRCSPHLLPEFLAYYTRTSAARAYFAATGVKTTNLASTNSTKVLELQLPSMSIGEQRDRVSAVESLVSVTRATRAAIARQSAAIRERRDALITAAVTGQLDVTTASGATA